MKSYRLPALAAVAFVVACAASNPNVAAKAGSEQLSVTRLADIHHRHAIEGSVCPPQTLHTNTNHFS